MFLSLLTITNSLFKNREQIGVAHSKLYQKTYFNAIFTNEHMSNRDQNEGH